MRSKFLSRIERKVATLQGKGWGSGTVKEEVQAVSSLLNSRDVQLCVDIGGNKGIYTDEILKLFPNCQIVIFEPSQTNFDHLIAKFAPYPNVQIEQSAVSDGTGPATLYTDEAGSGLASLTKRRLDHFGIDFDMTEEIRTIRFEDYWKEQLSSRPIDICKLDIEGHELDALAGFGDALRFTDVIQFEFGGCNIDTRTFFQDFWYFFLENNFKIYRITPKDPMLIESYSEFDEFFSTTNYIAKKK